MEKTHDDRDVRAQGLPCALRGLPAVRVHGVRRLILLPGLRFVGKDAIRLLQVRLRR